LIFITIENPIFVEGLKEISDANMKVLP